MLSLRSRKYLVVPMVAAACAAPPDDRNVNERSTTQTTPSSTSGKGADSANSHYNATVDSLRFIEHDENLPPGFPAHGTSLTLRNPYEGDRNAIKVGGQLYVSYNCVDCHGVDGSGSMAPTFQDSRWHFGGSPGAVFESIYQGRPDGMPAWGGRISNDQIWMLTAYVRSLSTGDVTTENFTGKTVERTGH